MPRSILLPREPQRPRDYWAALFVIGVHAIAIVLLPSWTIPVPVTFQESPVRVVTPALRFLSVAPVSSRTAPVRDVRGTETTGPVSLPIENVGSVPFAPLPSASRAPAEKAEHKDVPAGLLDQPFALLPRDPRLWAPSTITLRPAAGLKVLRDSIAELRSAARQPTGWILRAGEERYGVSPGALHLGGIMIPVPTFISLRDVDPQRRADRSMLREVAEQAERQRRDSIVSTRRRP